MNGADNSASAPIGGAGIVGLRKAKPSDIERAKFGGVLFRRPSLCHSVPRIVRREQRFSLGAGEQVKPVSALDFRERLALKLRVP